MHCLLAQASWMELSDGSPTLQDVQSVEVGLL